jgi:geranylgeranylglycerol-phosphate geranylgeranyltransferase
VSAALPFPVSHPAFWRAYWITLRPYLFFVSGTSGLVGLALGDPLPPVFLGAAFLAFSLSYGLGQALTDVFQTDTDALSSPYRPLVRGEISKRSVLVVSLLGLFACTAVFALLSPFTLVLGGVAVLGLLAYTDAKRRFWAGPFWNAWIVGLLPAMGLLCASRSASAALLHPGLSWAVATTLLGYSVFVLLGYFKDVEADRATGYVTLPVRFGRRTSVLVSAVACTLGLFCSLLLLRASGLQWHDAVSPGSMLWLAGSALLLGAHLRILPTTRDDEAHPAIAMVVRGYVLLRLGEVVLLRAGLTLLALLVYAAFELALSRRPCREQI